MYEHGYLQFNHTNVKDFWEIKTGQIRQVAVTTVQRAQDELQEIRNTMRVLNLLITRSGQCWHTRDSCPALANTSHVGEFRACAMCVQVAMVHGHFNAAPADGGTTLGQDLQFFLDQADF